MKSILFLIVATFLMSGCSGGGSTDNPTTPIINDGDNSGSQVGDEIEDPKDMLPSDPPSKTPEKTEATYQITFTSKCNRRDHLSRPSNAHFSPIVLTFHRAR
jgi:hypothetical protein